MTIVEMLEYLDLPTDIYLDKWDELMLLRTVRVNLQCDNCTKTDDETSGCGKYYLKVENGRLVQYAKTCDKSKAYYAQKHIDKLAKKSNIDARFEGKTFDNFKPVAGTKYALGKCREFCPDFLKRTKGLYLSGQKGCGKTHLAAAIWNELKKMGYVGVFVVAADFLDLKRRAMNNDELKLVAEELFVKARTAPLLVLDDLGAEKPSEWTQEQLFILIDARYRNGLPIVVTSNHALNEELEERIGDRSFSRLAEMTTYIWIDAPDYRVSQLSRGDKHEKEEDIFANFE